MEKREIRINDKWYSVGDMVEMESTKKTLFSKKKIQLKYIVTFIGNDSVATLVSEDGKIEKTIIGRVNISQI